MKLCLLYGFGIALALALLSLLLYAFGVHSEPARLAATRSIVAGLSLAIAFAGLWFGLRARRDAWPEDQPFTYGRALLTGIWITLFAALLGAVVNHLYAYVLHPRFPEVMVEAQLLTLEKAGRSPEDLEKAEQAMQVYVHPVFQGIFRVVSGLLFGTLISLVLAAVLRRPARRGGEAAV